MSTPQVVEATLSDNRIPNSYVFLLKPRKTRSIFLGYDINLAFDLEDQEKKEALITTLTREYRALAVGKPVEITSNKHRSVFGAYYAIHMNFITNNVAADEATKTFNSTRLLVIGTILTKLLRQEGYKLSSISQRTIGNLGQNNRSIYTFEEVLF